MFINISVVGILKLYFQVSYIFVNKIYLDNREFECILKALVIRRGIVRIMKPLWLSSMEGIPQIMTTL